MLFPKSPTTAEEIRDFCGRFSEGLRVEYKANLDDPVRKALLKIVSSFANSRGGVLILGVRTQPIRPHPGVTPRCGRFISKGAAKLPG